MADWDVIAKQRLTEDWGTLRSAYLPLNQAMRRTVEFLEKGNGSFAEVLTGVRERLARGLTHPRPVRGAVESLERGSGSCAGVWPVARERLEGSLKNLSALANRRSPWVR